MHLFYDQFVNLLKRLEGDENDGFRMKSILAVNRHWYDVLLDYLPTKLTIDWNQLETFAEKSDNKLMKALKQENLNDLKHFKINGLYDTERFESTLFTSILSDMTYVTENSPIILTIDHNA